MSLFSLSLTWQFVPHDSTSSSWSRDGASRFVSAYTWLQDRRPSRRSGCHVSVIRRPVSRGRERTEPPPLNYSDFKVLACISVDGVWSRVNSMGAGSWSEFLCRSNETLRLNRDRVRWREFRWCASVSWWTRRGRWGGASWWRGRARGADAGPAWPTWRRRRGFVTSRSTGSRGRPSSAPSAVLFSSLIDDFCGHDHVALFSCFIFFLFWINDVLFISYIQRCEPLGSLVRLIVPISINNRGRSLNECRFVAEVYMLFSADFASRLGYVQIHIW